MLEVLNGNIPRVAKLVGHESWEMVRLYNKDRLDDADVKNVNLFAA